MRLLFFSHIHPNPLEPQRGTYNVTLLRALSANHDIRAIVPVPWTTTIRHRRNTPAPITESWPTVFPRFYFTPKVFRTRYAEFMWQSVRPAARRIIRDFAPEAVLADWAHPDGAVAARIAREACVPCVTIVGGSDVLVLTRDPARRRAVLRALRDADAVVTVSHDIRRVLLDYGLHPAQVQCVYRGLDSTIFFPGSRCEARRRLSIDADRQVLLFVGNLLPVKGVDVLLGACAKLRADGRDVHLYVVGRGPVSGQLQQQAATLGLSGAVTFVGGVPNAQLPDWYRAANLTVLSSHSEGIPNVLSESIACGTPFVATEVGGVTELADPVLDRLVPAGDVAQLAKGISGALDAAANGKATVRAMLPRPASACARDITELIERVARRSAERTTPTFLEAAC